MSVRVAVFASGGGTNLQALLDAFQGDAATRGRGDAASGAVQIVLVLSDRPDAGALERARRAGVATAVVAVAGREPGDVAQDMLAALDEAGAQLIALAGFLRLVPSPVIERFRGRTLNIHPALLPAFGGKGMYGMRVHRAVLEAGCRVSGATVHFVDERYDTGAILAQWPVPVFPSDSPEELAARVLAVEHRLYPAAVEAVARGLVGKEGQPPLAFRLEPADAPAVHEIRSFMGLGPEQRSLPDADR